MKETVSKEVTENGTSFHPISVMISRIRVVTETREVPVTISRIREREETDTGTLRCKDIHVKIRHSRRRRKKATL